jgi:hypothetical protein
MPDRIKQEIEELLARLDTFPPPRPWYKRAWDSVTGWFAGIGHALGSLRIPSLSAGHILLLAIAAVVAVFLIAPDGDASKWIIAGGVVIFIIAFILSLRRRSSKPTEKYWRDRPMDIDRRNRRDRDR